MLFSEVIGQEEIKKDLRETVAQKRIAHAYLFSGPEGSGKLPLALAYAQYINCEHPTATDSCGQCPSCRAFAKLQHPDLHFVFPIVKDKKIDKLCCDDYLEEWRMLFAQNPYISLEMWQSYIGVENKQPMIYESEAAGDELTPRIQGLIRKLSITNYSAKYKVLIIWMAEKMNTVFANKILKVLEEPNPNTLIILISEHSQELLPTIISRTQLVRIPKIDDETLAQRIHEEYMLEGNELNALVRNANGNYVRAAQMFQANDVPTQNFELFTQIMRLAWKIDLIGLNGILENVEKLGREKQKSFLQYCLRQIRENFIQNQNAPSILYMDNQERAFSEKFHKFINEKNVEGFYNEFNFAYNQIARNGNSKIIFFDLFMQIIVLLKKQ